MTHKSSFNVTIDDERISIPLEDARASCPDEVVAMEMAGHRVEKASEGSDDQEIGAAALELAKRMRELLHCLAEAASKQIGD